MVRQARQQPYLNFQELIEITENNVELWNSCPKEPKEWILVEQLIAWGSL